MLEYLKDFRLLILIILIALLAVLDLLYGGPNGLHLGVEFIGGTQIPIQLEHSVDPQTMSNIIDVLKGRLSTFGLQQVLVVSEGTSALSITIPTVSPAEINNTISIIQSQGTFQGIVNGQEAINGSSLVSGSVGAIQPTTVGTNVSWSVAFFITQQAAEKFAKVAFGQANKPLYMFLDRPESAVVLVNASLLNLSSSPLTLGSSLSSMQQALQQASLFGNRTIAVQIYGSNSTINATEAFLSSHRSQYSKVVLTKSVPASIVSEAKGLNYTLDYVSPQNMSPTFIPTQAGPLIADTWPAVGLLSAPLLNPGVTNGNISQSYAISGFAPSTLSLPAKESYAVNQSNKIVSILRGGALPVHVIVLSPQTTPPTLGKHFEYVSALALIFAVIAVSVSISIRYKKLFLVAPILFTTLAELFIIGSLIGLIGTIDLSAVAGMIAVIGTGVDAQIIITDEVVSTLGEHGLKVRLHNAFYIIWADAALLAIAMLPLLFSTTLYDIIGFAESTILGVLFGAFLTRPAYGSIIEKRLEKAGS